MASIVSINISGKKGVIKQPVDEARLQADFGIAGDAHAGRWHRQISLLSVSSIEKMRALGAGDLPPGIFAENITVEGLDVATLPIGATLQLGECVVEVTQIGKECHRHCEIYKKVGNCVMPKEGIFAVVHKGGVIHPGDAIKVL
ncbi:MAG: MOSC domain-containing protein [Clostridiales bacterium]|jgi:MOSC domain-containing protein YiiM|nr:MOSC domain-containing protein [Clostridiales bacterium]